MVPSRESRRESWLYGAVRRTAGKVTELAEMSWWPWRRVIKKLRKVVSYEYS